MVHTIHGYQWRPNGTPQGSPLIQIHNVVRHIHGNGIAVHVYGEMKIGAKEVVYARDLKLKTLQVLLLTVESGAHYPFTAQKWIYSKGYLDNYASVDVFAFDYAYEMLPSGRQTQISAPPYLPDEGSIWLNFEAVGE